MNLVRGVEARHLQLEGRKQMLFLKKMVTNLARMPRLCGPHRGPGKGRGDRQCQVGGI